MMTWRPILKAGGGPDNRPQQAQMVEPDPASVWSSPPMLGLYGTVIVALVAPVVIMWVKYRLKCRVPS